MHGCITAVVSPLGDAICMHCRALAYRVAVTAYCGQFNRTSPNCSFPCSNSGEVCAPMDLPCLGSEVTIILPPFFMQLVARPCVPVSMTVHAVVKLPTQKLLPERRLAMATPNMTQCRANPG